jgi:hypothetical protein
MVRVEARPGLQFFSAKQAVCFESHVNLPTGAYLCGLPPSDPHEECRGQSRKQRQKA